MDVTSVVTNFNSSSQTGQTGTSSSGSSEVDSEIKQPTEPKTATELNKQNEEDIKKQLNKTVESLNSQMDMLNTNIQFGFNDKINTMYVDVHEKSSGRLIRKFPTEEAMRLAEHMREFIGILFDKKG